MRSSAIIVVIAWIALVSIAAAALASPPLTIASANGTADPPRIEVLSSRADGLTLQLRLPAITVDPMAVNGQTFQKVAIPGGASIGEIGQPEIPIFSRLVMIPAGSGVRITTTITEEEELTGYRLSPMQSDTEIHPAFAYDASSYARDDYGSTPTAVVGRPAVLRDLRVVPLRFAPIRYDPATGSLKVARTVRVDVSFEGQDAENELLTPASRPIAPSFDRIYRDLVVNYGDSREAALGVAPGTWVVICANDANVVSKLQPLLIWHQRKGYPVRLATTAETGTTKEAIQSWLRNAYATWPIPPEYVTLAGDADAIPVWYENLSGYGGGGDHPYSQMDGADILSDVNIGRLSFNSTTELDVEVAKCVGYESAPYTSSDTGWFTRGALVGDPGQSGFSVVQLQQWVKSRLLEIRYSQVDTVFSGDFVGQMTTDLNRGDTVFSYRGWLGMSGFNVSNIAALTNTWKLPFCVTITCDTGTFYSGTSRTEEFLKAGTTSSPRGGIGAIGTATTGTHTRYNNCMHYGILYGLLYEGLYTMGADLTRGKLEMYMNYQVGDPNHVTIWSYWNNLMGDPAVEIFTGYPAAISVTHPANLAIGTNSVPVTVKESPSQQPIANAQVCLWKGSETYVVGFTDSQGQVELPVSLQSTGNLLITVTKHNRYPYLFSIPVAAQSVFVGYQSSTVSDDNSGGSHGNSDGIVNPGETIELRVQLKNFGSQSAPGVTAALTTADPYVTITNGSQTYGDIAGGATAWSAGSYIFSVGLGCPQGHAVRFGLDVRSGASLWHSLIDQPVVSADLVAEGSTLYNVGSNGILDPGESGQMSVKLRNRGGLAATATTGVLTSLSPLVTVTDANGTFGDIAAGQLAENTADRFAISAASNTYQGYLATLRMVNQFSGGMLDTTLVSLTVGTRSSDDPVGPDAHGYYAFDNTDLAYPECPVYSWVELDPSYGGSGTQIPLSDMGQYQDDSRTVPLPFSFVYYGETFPKITVCSNGWIAMGSTYLTDYRNWTIPSAGGPDDMIAAFWDDLNLSSGKVLDQYDAANHRFIIEWSRVSNDQGSQQTFEVILYDPAFYPTPSGDGAILCQYSTVNNTDSGENYTTVGIENHLHTDGILYTFDNRYASGAAPLQSGRAIRFVPAAAVPAGTIQGTVSNASNAGSPISGAEVVLLETGRSFTTDADGHYVGPVATGTYTVVARQASFEPDTVRNVVITLQSPVTVDFSLTDILGPSISGVTDDMMTTDTVGPYPIEATVTDSSTVASVKLYYRLDQGGWVGIPMTLTGGHGYSATIPGAPSGTRIDYYVWAQDNGGNSSTSPADAPTHTYTLLVLASVYSFRCEGASDAGWELGHSGDTATTGLWIRDDPVGTTYGTPPWQVQPEDDHTLGADSVKCFVTGNGDVGGDAGQNDVDGGCTTLTSPVFGITGAETAYVSYWRWFAIGGNSADDTFQVDISDDGGASWVPFERVSDNENRWTHVTMDVSQFFSPLPATIQLRFIACDLNSPGLVEAAIDDIAINAYIPNPASAPEGLPTRTGLTMTRPNPFQPSTTIQYALAKPARVSMVIYDVAGRVVRTLVNGNEPAGYHSVIWNGRDERAASVPSGIYFCRFHAAGSGSEVRKLIRLE